MHHMICSTASLDAHQCATCCDHEHVSKRITCCDHTWNELSHARIVAVPLGHARSLLDRHSSWAKHLLLRAHVVHIACGKKMKKKLAYNLEISKDRLSKIIYAIGWAEVIQVFFLLSLFCFQRGLVICACAGAPTFVTAQNFNASSWGLGTQMFFFVWRKKSSTGEIQLCLFAIQKHYRWLPRKAMASMYYLTRTHTGRGTNWVAFFLAIFVPTSKWHTWCKNNLTCVWCLIFPHFF